VLIEEWNTPLLYVVLMLLCILGAYTLVCAAAWVWEISWLPTIIPKVT